MYRPLSGEIALRALDDDRRVSVLINQRRPLLPVLRIAARAILSNVDVAVLATCGNNVSVPNCDDPHSRWLPRNVPVLDSVIYTGLTLSRHVPQNDHRGTHEPNTVQFNLAELADKSATPERTIRYYITRGILAGPVRRGRGAVYTTEHLARLAEIRRQQQRGHTLAEIERETCGSEGVRLAEPQAWWLYPVSDDVLVQVRGGINPWRARVVKSALVKLARQLSSDDGEKDK
jgi:hypothetical protein